MPYFVYRVLSFKRLEKVGDFATYKEASIQLRARRKEAPSGADYRYRLIFAENELQAEDLLLQERPPEGFVGDDY